MQREGARLRDARPLGDLSSLSQASVLRDSHTGERRMSEQAFPTADTVHPNGQVQYGSNGMTLRDYAAFKVLPAMYTDRNWSDYGQLAENAYKLADAMLKARAENAE